MKLGILTIGQSPRVDLTKDILPLLEKGTEVIERGALDNLNKPEVEKLAPENDGHLLVTRMKDGTQVRLSEEKLLPLLQEGIDYLEGKGCSLILLLCTGEFPPFRHSALLIRPQELLNQVVGLIADGLPLGVMVPDGKQVPQAQTRWEGRTSRLSLSFGSPYLEMDGIREAAVKLKEASPSLIFLDCMGYTVEMKNMVETITGARVILPRTLIIRIINELLASGSPGAEEPAGTPSRKK